MRTIACPHPECQGMPLQLLGNSLQRLVSTIPVGAIAMYTANLNSLAPETLKKCSCLLSYHFLLVRYAKMCILMVAVL